MIEPTFTAKREFFYDEEDEDGLFDSDSSYDYDDEDSLDFLMKTVSKFRIKFQILIKLTMLMTKVIPTQI